jgi:N,N-dimethylformamidase
MDLDEGISTLRDYRVLVLLTYPEYWSLSMIDNLTEYLDGGGSVIYLGGNGMFERCEYTPDRTALTFFGGDPTQGRDRNFWRNQNPPRPERSLLGVAFRMNNQLKYCNPAPYQVVNCTHRFFRGTFRAAGGELQNGDLIGLTGRNGAASGWEMDTSQSGFAPDGVIVNAWEPGLSTYDDSNIATGIPGTDRGSPPSNLQILARKESTLLT